MPELPEVETVLRTLEKQVKNARIQDIEIFYNGIINGDANVFKNKLIGQSFRFFYRRGKYLIFELDNIALVSHLRMEGKYFIYPQETIRNKHTHLIFKLTDGRQIHYNDVRKFGRFELIPVSKDHYHSFKNLGVEPFWDSFNTDYVYDYIKNKNSKIKVLLLDQSFIAGIGNIYADEILFASKISPLETASYLSKAQCADLVKNTKEILKAAIAKGGTTIKSYTSSLGITGRFQMSLRVYGRAGLKCPNCQNELVKTKVASRSTYYCPNCQKNTKYYAITGSLGAGKSSFSELLLKKGFYVFNCDEVNNELLNNQAVIKQIAIKFPDCIENNILNRKRLANIIFNDKEAKKDLESILHPLILEKMLMAMSEHSLFFAEVPLLFESGFDFYFSKTIIISCNEKKRIARLRKRGLNIDEINKRTASQMSSRDREKLADFVIDNSSSKDHLNNELNLWLRKNHVRQ